MGAAAAPRPDQLSTQPLGPPRPPPGFHGAVTDFKRRLIEATLAQVGGNRTQAARALGLQRTYLLRLIREFGVDVPRRGAAAVMQPREVGAGPERSQGH